MNFTPVLSAFQGAILSADNVHHFGKLTAKGGNEDQINYVVESLSRFLRQGQFVRDGKIPSSTTSDVRRFALYIVLNADLPELQELVDTDEISSVIWTAPTIPRCLMCELMWNLHMEEFIFEIISFVKPQLGLEVAVAFLDNFKYFNPLHCLKQLEILSTACYLFICRLHFFNFEPAKLSSQSTAAFNNFQQCLKYYTTPPNNYKLNVLHKVELHKYQGKSLHSLLHLVDECLAYFTNKLDINPKESDIYELTYGEESIKKDISAFNICDSSNNILAECLNKANIAMLDTCKALVMDVSVDVFCCWSEFEENGISMQQTIGELCYKVRNRLLNLNTLAEHPLVSMFEQIARKPIEMKDIINATEDNIIVQNINSNNESKSWIKALVYKENLCHNTELLDIVVANLDMYDEEESYRLYSVFEIYVNSNSKNKDYVESLCVKVFQKCDTPKKYSILEEHFNNKTLTDMKETTEFNNLMTSVFNKLISSPEANLSDILTLFLQSPQKVYNRLFSLACENIQQTRLMLKVMKLFENFSDHYYSMATEPCLIQVTREIFDNHIDTEAKQKNFIKFVCGLKNDKIIPGTKLLLLIIMTNMHKALLDKDINKLNVQIKLLQEAFDLQELTEYRAPMLAMLAQVIDVVRWKINTFCIIAPPTLVTALDLQTSIIKTYNDGLPENEKIWLKNKLSHLNPLNMYYYRLLWNPPGCNYLEIVSGRSVDKNINVDDLTLWLSQVVCSCTQLEWCEIWDSLKECFDNSTILKIFHDAITMVTLAEKPNRTDNSRACIFYCYRNVVFITRYKFITEPLNDDQVQLVVSKVASMAELVTQEDVEELRTVLLPLFAYLTERRKDYNINFLECLTDNLNHTSLSSMINKLFANGTG